MKKSIALILLLLCATLHAQNTSFTVKGLLHDSLSGEPEMYATVRISPKGNAQKTTSIGLSGQDGRFSLKFESAPGDYVMTVKSIGKVTYTRQLKLTQAQHIVDAGTIALATRDRVLAGAVVKAKKPLVTAEVDRVGYSIADDPDSKTQTTLEMLRKVPLVTVDGEDNIQVNGSSSFKVFVNGKPSNLMSKSPSDVLKSLPANAVKKIEVITSPGAKYDAEGVGGILNVVMERGSDIEGYSATIRTSAGTRDMGAGTFVTVKSGKLTLSADYNFRYGFSHKGYSDADRENYASQSEHMEVSHSENHGNRRNHFGTLEASYEIDSLRLLTVSGDMWYGGNHSYNNGSTVMYDAQMAPVYQYSTDNRTRSSWASYDASLDYQRSFRTEGRMLTFSYRLESSPGTNNGTQYYIDTLNVPSKLELKNRYTDGHENTLENTFQLDFTTPFGKLHTLETGVKYILRNNTSRNMPYVLEGNASSLETARASDYKHRNDILAAYLSYQLKYKDLTVKPGLRYEHTFQKVTYKMGPGANFSTSYDDLVPSMSIGYKPALTQMLSLAYSMRISRPGIWNLNPYFDNTNPMSITQGNSDLKSEKSHSLEFRYSYFSTKFTVNTTLRHSFTNNSIEEVTRMIGAAGEIIDGHAVPAGALYTTSANIGHSNESQLSLNLNWNPITDLRIYTYSRLSYVDMKSPAQQLHNSGWRLNAGGGIQYTMPYKIQVSLNGGGGTPNIALQGRGSGYNYYSFSINRSFLKEDRLNISMGASDFLQKYMKFGRTSFGTNYRSSTSMRFYRPSFNINVSYRLGSLNATVKKVSRSIENNDVKGNSSGGGNSTTGGEGGNS